MFGKVDLNNQRFMIAYTICHNNHKRKHESLPYGTLLYERLVIKTEFPGTEY